MEKNIKLGRYAEIIRREQQALDFTEEELEHLRKALSNQKFSNVAQYDATATVYIFQGHVLGEISDVDFIRKIIKLEAPQIFALIELFENKNKKVL